MSDAIIVEDLRHRYGGLDVLKGVSFTVHAGEVFGILGPNGAGKTTLSSILTSQLRPTSGSVSLLGLDPVSRGGELRRRIGLAAHELRMSEHLTGLQALRFQGHLYGLHGFSLEKRIRELIKTVGLDHKQDGLIGSYSEGMKRRLNVALSLVHDPEVVFLDEPTSGLDAASERAVTEALGHLMKGRTSIVIAHHLATIRNADVIFVMKDTDIVERGTHEQLLARGGVYAELYAIQAGNEVVP